MDTGLKVLYEQEQHMLIEYTESRAGKQKYWEAATVLLNKSAKN